MKRRKCRQVCKHRPQAAQRRCPQSRGQSVGLGLRNQGGKDLAGRRNGRCKGPEVLKEAGAAGNSEVATE